LGAFAACRFSLPLRAVENTHVDADGLISYIYTPTEKPDPVKTYWLVVGVHGAGGTGQGACGVANWATTFDDVIVLGPSFAQPKPGNAPKRDPAAPPMTVMPRDSYQMAGPVPDAKLKALIAEIGRTWKLHPKILGHGFSAGAQFVHRFAFNNPTLVAAVSAHSAGTWATQEGGDRINPEARAIPFALSCGENDLAKSFPGAAGTRLGLCRAFAADLLGLGFNVQLGTWPGVGHAQSAAALAMARALLDRIRLSPITPAPGARNVSDTPVGSGPSPSETRG
jgi:poly(3-hydroxybutyrate) depolymerase